MKRFSIFFITLFCLLSIAQANFLNELQNDRFAGTSGSNSRFLSEQEAFPMSARLVAPNLVEVSWQMPPGYYLYRHSLRFESKPKLLQQPQLPKGIEKKDEFLGQYEIYENSLLVKIPLKASVQKLQLTSFFQGCSDAGYCYPPMQRHVDIQVDLGANGPPPNNGTTPLAVQAISTSPDESPQDHITHLLEQNTLWVILLAFFGFGLLLSFTPCVLPMLPIISSILLGKHQKPSRLRALLLSSVYVLAIALTYAMAGILAGLAGASLQATLQTPFVLSLIALLFVLLALSMFGFYEINLPVALENKLNQMSRSQHGGEVLGVFIMGGISALVVSPCVTAPLVGALTYISHSGDATLGGLALFTLGLGMGFPIILIATVGSHLLPKAGPWMNGIKAFFGVILLAMALLMLSRFVSGHIMMFLWAMLAIGVAVFLNIFQTVSTTTEKTLQVVGYTGFVYGVLLIIGASMGATDPLLPLAPLERLGSTSQSTAELSFTRVTKLPTLEQAMLQATERQKPTLLVFSADWCLSCHIIKRNVFQDAEVQRRLQFYQLIEADVTKNNLETKALMQRFSVFAPPSLLFFNRAGKEATALRIVAETDKKTFLDHLDKLEAQARLPLAAVATTE